MSSMPECTKCGDYVYYGPCLCEKCLKILRARAEIAEGKLGAVRAWVEKNESSPPWIAVYYTDWDELKKILK